MYKNMSLTFRMTAEDYNAVWEYKNKKCLGINKTRQILIFILSIVLLAVCAYFYSIYLFVSVSALGIAALAASAAARKRRSENIFLHSPVLMSEFTVKTDEKQLQIINGYEKISVPWQSVFSVKETKKHILILPTYMKGSVAINKESCRGKDLENLLSVLKENCKTEAVEK